MKKRVLIPIVIAIVAIIATIVIVTDPFQASNGNSTTNSTNYTPSSDNNWINPGKSFLTSCTAGTSHEWQLEIYNANNGSATFSVDYRVPDWVQEGYARPTQDVRDWVYISNKRPVIAPHSTYNVTISLGMPSYGVAPGPQWEFWIGVIDQSQTGFVQVELAARFLVTMG